MLTILSPSAARRMPWKNGRGSTLELASDATSSRPWTWRVSIADVPESGPFSTFDGCDREIACLEGDGMRLVVDGVPRDVPRAGRALRFSGNAETRGELLGGPCRDVNLIWSRSAWRGSLELLRGAIDSNRDADLALVHLVAGDITVNDQQVLCGGSVLVEREHLRYIGNGVAVVALLSPM